MRTIVVAPYDAAWAAAFEKIAGELREALGAVALSVEHVGSTSVEGLWAKPIIDIDVVIEDKGALPLASERLAAIGYEPEGERGVADRYAFRYQGKAHLMAHHLYVCPKGSKELARHTALRDCLRENEALRAAYSEVKREGARLFPHDIEGYIAHKTGVIGRIYESCGLSLADE